MQIQRITRQKNTAYTTVSNVIVRDNRLSLKAKGFFLTVMSLPCEWDFSVEGMMKILKENRDAIYAVIRELKRYGYCKHEQTRNERGVLGESTYTFIETPDFIEVKPHTENPHTDKPDTGQPDTENPTQLKKEGIKERKKQGKKKSSPEDLATRPDLDDEAFVVFLSSKPEYRGIDVSKKFKTMLDWCEKKKQTPTRLRLLNWLNREEAELPIVIPTGHHGPGCDICRNDPNRSKITLKRGGYIFKPEEGRVVPCVCNRNGSTQRPQPTA